MVLVCASCDELLRQPRMVHLFQMDRLWRTRFAMVVPWHVQLYTVCKTVQRLTVQRLLYI
jgi:hypothetical protein